MESIALFQNALGVQTARTPNALPTVYTNPAKHAPMQTSCVDKACDATMIPFLAVNRGYQAVSHGTVL